MAKFKYIGQPEHHTERRHGNGALAGLDKHSGDPASRQSVSFNAHGGKVVEFPRDVAVEVADDVTIGDPLKPVKLADKLRGNSHFAEVVAKAPKDPAAPTKKRAKKAAQPSA